MNNKGKVLDLTERLQAKQKATERAAFRTFYDNCLAKDLTDQQFAEKVADYLSKLLRGKAAR